MDKNKNGAENPFTFLVCDDIKNSNSLHRRASEFVSKALINKKPATKSLDYLHIYKYYLAHEMSCDRSKVLNLYSFFEMLATHSWILSKVEEDENGLRYFVTNAILNRQFIKVDA